VNKPNRQVAVTLSDEAKSDVKVLAASTAPEDQTAERALAIEVAKVAFEIQDHPWVGDPLRDDGKIPRIGDLRKVAFDPSATGPPRFRLVYRLKPNDRNPTVAEIVAIGPRRNMTVYKTASKRNS